MQKAILRNIKSVNPLRKDPDMTIVFSLGNNEKGKSTLDYYHFKAA